MDGQLSQQLARYVTIAVDIATRIEHGEYREGQKIFGRSTLAGRYNVSPETIRRALTLLQETGIVQVAPGVGVVVKSQRAAEAFLADYGQRQVLKDLQARLHSLLRERDRLNLEIEKHMNELLNFTTKVMGRLERIEEVKVQANSPLVGKSLDEAKFRSRTGATILAIYRNGEEILGPQAETVIQAGDALILVGHPEAKEHVLNLVREDVKENRQDETP